LERWRELRGLGGSHAERVEAENGRELRRIIGRTPQYVGAADPCAIVADRVPRKVVVERVLAAREARLGVGVLDAARLVGLFRFAHPR
jgi:hypothetical protein